MSGQIPPIPGQSTQSFPTIYPTFSTSNGVGCLSNDLNYSVGLNEYGIMIGTTLTTVPNTLLINATGITINHVTDINWTDLFNTVSKSSSIINPPTMQLYLC